MEGNYDRLRYDLDLSQKNVMELQSELLRVDYQYGVIVKDLKQKYKAIAVQFNTNAGITKQLRRQIKKLQHHLSTKSKQNEQLQQQLQENINKLSNQAQNIHRLKQQNEKLKNQIKYLQANQNKYQMRAQQMSKKNQQYKQQNYKLQQKIQVLQKELKKLSGQKKQLQELVQHEMLETQHRIQNIGNELISIHHLQQTNKLNSEINLESFHTNTKTVHKNREVLIDDWESDMKKLKNCIDYGNSYIVVFDPANLDRMPSKEIFKYLKKCLNQKADAEMHLMEFKQNNQKIVDELKQKLISFQQEIMRIQEVKNKTITIDSVMQTQNKHSLSTQKAFFQLSELNTKLKIRNSTLIECIEILALRYVATAHLLHNSHTNSLYYKTLAYKGRKFQAKSKTAGLSKLRKVFYSVLFIQFVKKKSKLTQKLLKQQREIKQKYQKIEVQTMKLDKQSINNVEIEKMKDLWPATDRKNLYLKIEQITSYYEFKLKNKLKQKQITKQLLF